LGLRNNWVPTRRSACGA